MADQNEQASDPDHVASTTINDLFGGDNEQEHDPFAQLDEPTQPVAEDEQPAKQPIAMEEAQAPIMADRDFSDLLAEFEAEQADQEAEQPAPQPSAPALPVEPESAAPVILNEAEHDPFDDLLQNGHVAEQNHDPDLSNKAQIGQGVAQPAAGMTNGLFDSDPSSSAFDDLGLDQPAVSPMNEPVQGKAIPPSSPNGLEDPVAQIAYSHGMTNSHEETSAQNLFNDDSDWLADTSVDEFMTTEANGPADDFSPLQSSSLIPDPPVTVPKPLHEMEEDGNEPVSFEVPQGWFDDNGNWQWYTEEEKEAVRQAMMGEGNLEPGPGPMTGTSSLSAAASPGLLPSPSLQPYSENNARRTPIPENTDPFDSLASASMYAPSSSHPQTASSSAYAASGSAPPTASLTPGYSPYAPTQSGQMQTSGYGYGQAHGQASGGQFQTPSYAPTAPAQSSPYAPGPQAQVSSPYDPPPSNPYAPPPSTSSPYSPNRSYGQNLSRSGMSSSSTAPNLFPTPAQQLKPKPPPPQRMPSTAYDPPMLKSQKSFARSASAVYSSPGFVMASLPPGQSGQSQTPVQGTPNAPPAGPPRRSKTPGMGGGGGDMGPPPMPSTVGSAQSQTTGQMGQMEMSPPTLTQSTPSYAPPPSSNEPPSRPPFVPQGPTRSVTYNAFDPPLRPSSTASTSRSPNVLPAQQTPLPPTSSGLSPPQTAPSTGLSPGYEPPRSASRGSQRKHSPMFESRPTFDRPPSWTASEARPTSRPAFEAGPPSSSAQVERPPSRSIVEDRPASRPVVDSRPPSRADLNARPPSRSTFQPPPPLSKPSRPNVQDIFQNPPPQAAEEVSPVAGLGLTGHLSPTNESYAPIVAERTFEEEYAQEYGGSASGIAQLDEGHLPHQQYQSTSISSDPFIADDPPLSSVPRQSNGRYDSAQAQRPAYQEPMYTAPTQNQQVQNSYMPDPYGPSPAAPQESYMPNPYQATPANQQNSYMPEPYQAPLDMTNQQYNYDPYAPGSAQPMSTPVKVPVINQSSYANDPYAPSSNNVTPARSNDMYNSNANGNVNGYGASYGGSPTKSFSPARALSPPDPYAPTSYAPSAMLATSVPSQSSEFGISPPQPNYFQSMSAQPQDDTYIPQQVLEQRPVSEDPLQRCTHAAKDRPLAIFGFGGLLITCFPGLADSEALQEGGQGPSYGYNSGRGRVILKPIAEVASSSALKSSDTSFPGPLILDPSTPKGTAGDKKKKETIIQYLKLRAEETEKGLPYLKTSASQMRREEEGKLVMTRLLIAMIEGDGKFTGSPAVEAALQAALTDPADSSSIGVLPTAISTSPLSPVKNFQTGYLRGPISPAKASQSQIVELSALLRSGNKREAVQVAMDAGLWSHALVISSSVDADLWRDVVLRFTAAELGAEAGNAAGMRASYALFSGPSSGSVDELFKAANITSDPSTDHWREVLGAVVFSGKPADVFTLDEFAARLDNAGLVSAAHACHLLSPTSPFSDNTPAAFERLIALTQNPRDEDALIFAEVAEYARSLVALPKGQESQVIGLPQLLPYKIQRAWRAADLGDVEQAQRYCTAVEAAARPSKNAPSLLPMALLASLEDLSERLTGKPSADPANLVMTGRKHKTNYSDKLGSWFEGRLTKFIAGDEDSSTSPVKQSAPKATTKNTPSGPIGPFSHFSTISPAASGQISRVASGEFGMNGALGLQQDPMRTSPAMLQGSWGQPLDAPQGSRSTSPSYNGDEYAPQDTASSFAPWQGSSGTANGEIEDLGEDAEGGDGLLNPMAALSLGPKPDTSRVDYVPQPLNSLDEDDDLGFGNASLSRNRTPKPSTDGEKSETPSPQKEKSSTDQKAEPVKPPGKPEQKGSWIGRWWGKKEGEGSGPVRAKLGDDSSMVFDPELKRWVVKGQKPEAAPAAPPPPPSRAQTASPSRTAGTAPTSRPPSAGPSSAGSLAPPALRMPRSATAPMGMSFTQMPDGGIKRAKPSLETIPGEDPPRGPSPSPSISSVGSASASAGSAPPPSGGGLAPPPATLPRSTTVTGASLDDLLSRPPSRRPGSSAANKRSMKSRYVDVFQSEAHGVE